MLCIDWIYCCMPCWCNNCCYLWHCVGNRLLNELLNGDCCMRVGGVC